MEAPKPPPQLYVLEAQLYAKKIGFIHVGYLNKIFESEDDACAYYDSKNPPMRKLNAHGAMHSDWDPKTMLRYVVRKYDRELCTLPEFQ